MRVSRVPTVKEGTSNLNISVKTRRKQDVSRCHGQSRKLSCIFVFHNSTPNPCELKNYHLESPANTNVSKIITEGRIADHGSKFIQLTSKWFFRTSTSRLHLAVGLLWCASTIRDCCDEVAHGQV